MALPLDGARIAEFRKTFTTLATRLYLEQGEAGVTMRSLAQAAGVSRQTPYTYFKNKDDILDHVRAEGFGRLTARYRAALERESEPLLRLRATARAYVNFAADEPALYSLMFQRRPIAKARHKVLDTAMREFGEIADAPVQACLRAHLIRGELEDIKQATWAAFHGAVSLYVAGHLTRERLDSLVEIVSDMIRYGILTPNAAKKMPRRAG